MVGKMTFSISFLIDDQEKSIAAASVNPKMFDWAELSSAILLAFEKNECIDCNTVVTNSKTVNTITYIS